VGEGITQKPAAAELFTKNITGNRPATFFHQKAGGFSSENSDTKSQIQWSIIILRIKHHQGSYFWVPSGKLT